MATTVRGVTTNTSAGATAITVAAVPGTLPGDLVIIVIGTNGARTVVDNNGATPFTEDHDSNEATQGKTLAIYSRRIQSGDPTTYAFTLSGSERWAIAAICLENPHPSTIYNVTPSVTHNTGSVTTDSAPNISPSTRDALHFAVCMLDRATGFTAKPTGYTDLADVGNQRTNVVMKVVPAGATGTGVTWTWTTGENSSVASFAIEGNPAKADINFEGFETGDFSRVFSTSGTVSVQTTIKRTGAYAMRASANSSYAQIRTINATGKTLVIGRTTETFYTFYVYFAAIPDSGSVIFSVISATSGVDADTLRMNGAAVRLDNLDGSTSADLFTPSINTWYRIDMRITSGGTSYAKVDGGSEVSNTAASQTQDSVYVGLRFAAGSLDMYYEDIVIGTTALDAGVGPCVRMAVPIGAGNYTGFNEGTNGIDFAEVDEVPHDSGTTYVEKATTQNVASTFNMQTAATAGIVGTIYALLSCVIMNEPSSTSTLGYARLRSGSTDADTTHVDVGSTTYIALQKLFPTDPADWAAWTPTKFDAIEVGPGKGADASTVRCTAAYLMVCEDGVTAGVAEQRPRPSITLQAANRGSTF